MKKFITTVKNIFSIEDLRIRILNTIGLLIVFRIGSFVVLPGVDPSRLGEAASGIFGLIDTFLGGSFSRASIFGLGIMPYISASIVLQSNYEGSYHLDNPGTRYWLYNSHYP